MVPGITRRSFLAAALGFPSIVRPALASISGPRVVALDWALAETLLALGHPPVAVVAASDWSRFVVEPRLPRDVADLGLQQEINLELLALLEPDLILMSPFIQGLDSALPRIARTENLSIFEPTNVPLDHPRQLTRTVGALIGRDLEAERFLQEAEERLDQYQSRLAAIDPPAVLVASLIDARHARIYGGSGLFQNVLDRMGVSNAWQEETGYWGFSTVGIERLASYGDVRLIVAGPVRPEIRVPLERSPLWSRLPFVRQGRISTLPAVFMFGAMPAALRFAQVLTERMERDAR